MKRILELLDCGDFFNDFVDPVIRKKLRPDPEPDAWCPVWFVESVTDAAKHMAKHKPQKLNRLIEPIVFRDSSVDDDEILGALEALLTHTRAGGASLSGAGGGLDGYRTCACAWSAKRHESGSGGGEPHLLLDGLVRPSLLWCARARADSHTVEKAVASITAARLRERRTTFNRILLRQPRQDELIEALEALSFERSVSAPQSAYYSSLTNEGISNGNTAGARRWLPSVAVVGDSVRRLAAAPLRRLRSRCGRRASRLRAAVKAVLPYSHFSEDRNSVRFPIIGLFRSTHGSVMINGSVPIFLIASYLIWQPLTRQLLLALACERYTILGVEVLRWAGDTQDECWDLSHVVGRTYLAVIGLLVWSVGLPLCLFAYVMGQEQNLATPRILHNVGFFYQGFGQERWWWELVVKRFDSFLVVFVSYSNAFPDLNTKLMLYLVLAGLCWALHLDLRPLDGPHTGGGGGGSKLLDHLEAHGLRLRFVTFFLIFMVLLVPSGCVFTLVLGIFVILINVLYIAVLLLAIMLEITARASSVRVEENPRIEKKRSVSQRLKRLAVSIMRPLLALSDERERLRHSVPHIKWSGGGRPLEVVDGPLADPPGNRFSRSVRRLMRHLVRQSYGLQRPTQLHLLCASVGRACGRWIGHSGIGACKLKVIPGGELVDVLAVLALAVRRVGGEDLYGGQLGKHELIQRMRIACSELCHEAWAEEQVANARVVSGMAISSAKQHGPHTAGDTGGSDGAAHLHGSHLLAPEDLDRGVAVLAGLGGEVTGELVEMLHDKLGQVTASTASASGILNLASVSLRREAPNGVCYGCTGREVVAPHDQAKMSRWEPIAEAIRDEHDENAFDGNGPVMEVDDDAFFMPFLDWIPFRQPAAAIAQRSAPPPEPEMHRTQFRC